MKRFFKEEKGAYLVTEATIVYPITFFVLLIMLYLGNNMFLRAAVQGVATKAAAYGVRQAVDPIAGDIKPGESVSDSFYNTQPYHHFIPLGGGSAAKAEKAAVELADKLMNEEVGTGFFAGTLKKGSHQTSAGYSFTVLANKFVVSIKYDTDIPMRLISAPDTRLGFYHEVTASVSGADPKEMIDLVNLAIDMVERSKYGETATKIYKKVQKFLSPV